MTGIEFAQRLNDKCFDIGDTDQSNIAREFDAALAAMTAEVVHLREENAALKAHGEELQRRVDVTHDDWITAEEAQERKLAVTKAALGRAHALIRLARSRFTGSQEGSERAECDAILADPEGRAAAEYVAALEAEHEAMRHLREQAHWRQPHTPTEERRNAAHAAVEALRTVTP